MWIRPPQEARSLGDDPTFGNKRIIKSKCF